MKFYLLIFCAFLATACSTTVTGTTFAPYGTNTITPPIPPISPDAFLSSVAASTVNITTRSTGTATRTFSAGRFNDDGVAFTATSDAAIPTALRGITFGLDLLTAPDISIYTNALNAVRFFRRSSANIDVSFGVIAQGEFSSDTNFAGDFVSTSGTFLNVVKGKVISASLTNSATPVTVFAFGADGTSGRTTVAIASPNPVIASNTSFGLQRVTSVLDGVYTNSGSTITLLVGLSTNSILTTFGTLVGTNTNQIGVSNRTIANP